MPLSVILALGFVIGAVLGPYLPYAPGLDLVVILPLSALFLFMLWRQRGPRITVLLLIAMLAGHGARVRQWRWQENIVQSLQDNRQKKIWIGVVESDLGHSGRSLGDRRKLRLRLRVDDAKFPVQSSFVAELKLGGAAAQWPRFSPGDAIRFRARLRPSAPAFMPGQFDGRALSMSRGVLARGSIYRRQQLVLMVKNYPWWRLNVHLKAWRQSLLDRLDANLDEQASALTRGMILGDRSDVTQELRAAFDGAGAGHLLAVSGLHVGSFAALIFFIAAWLARRSDWLMRRIPPRRFSALLAAPAGLAFAWLAGASPSAARAGMMSFAILIGIALWRPRATLSALGLAALAIVGASPAAVNDPSFVLSFSALIAILFMAPRLKSKFGADVPWKTADDPHAVQSSVQQRARRELKWKFSAALGSTLAASLISLPLSAYYFHRIAAWSVLANLVIIPLAGLALPLAIGGALLGLGLGSFGFVAGQNLLVHFAASLVLSLRDVCGFFADWPGALISVPTMSLWGLILIIAGLAGLFLWARQRRWRVFALGLLLVGCVVTISPALHFSHELRMYFLPVGQGDSTLIVAPNGQTLLVDCGSQVRDGPPRAGTEIVLPFLAMQGIKRLDYVAVTHPDSDHYNGLPDVIAATCPKELWWTGDGDKSGLWQAMLDAAKTCNTRLRFFDSKNHLVQMGELEVDILHPLVPPGSSLHYWPEFSRNDNSLVIALRYKKVQALLMGDAGWNAEDSLIDTGLRGPFDVLKAGHHGSSQSSSPAFLKAIKPRHTVLSAGYYNNFGHPTDRVLRLLKRNHSAIWRTDRQGLITATSDGQRLHIHGFLAGPEASAASAR